MEKALLVSVIDDDESVRESLPGLLKALGYQAQAYSSAEQYLLSEDRFKTRCLILDIAMPGLSGPELQTELKKRSLNTPIIFMTAHGDESIRRQLVQRGAVACLLKPFSDNDLVDALNLALPDN